METIEEMFDLKGKVAVVTGGSRGIGERISLRLAEAGAAVMIVDKQAADDTVNQIRNNGGTAHARLTDLSRCVEIEEAIEATIAVLGDIHILVNNAGIWPMTPFLELTEETWDITQTVNLKASAFCSQAAAKAMIKAGHGGTIINIGSESAIRPPLGKLAHYVAAKGGLVSLTKAIARELLPHGIRVNMVSPASIINVDVSKLTPDQRKRMEHRTRNLPLGRLGTPDDIARVVLFMASSASDYIIGHNIIADGGVLWLAKLEAES